MSEEPGSLTEAVERLEGGSADAKLWIDQVRVESVSVSNEAESLAESSRRAQLTARKLARAVSRHNCVGVFGPSQAGKSYLVSALARSKGTPLEIIFGSEWKNFLREINPPGDRESTGLVTRFTCHKGAVDPDYPVELRLLTETDLVKVLANSFFSDFDPNNMTIKLPEEADIRVVMKEVEGGAGKTTPRHLDDIVMFDLAEYFRRNFGSRIGTHDRANYWDALIHFGARLPLAQRAKAYSMLWGGLQEFTDLFVMLAEALERIGNPPDAKAALKGLVPRELDGRPNTMIDVAVLQRLGTKEDAQDQIDLLPVFDGVAGDATSLPRATLTALIAEVGMVIAEKPWPFFEHTDLLDFPGARSRLRLSALPNEPEDASEQLRELFLRGKISYLFQRYTDELELTSMLLCMPPSVQEVKDLSAMVKSWIATTHGATAERRQRVRNALFLVLTKYDLEFLEKGGETEDSRAGKWDRRLHSSVLELYGKDGWPDDWDGKPFDNTVFLRNPSMKQVHLMDYSDLDNLIESGESQQSANVIGQYREAFMTSALAEKHFRDRDAVWKAAMTPNDGGVEYLVGRLNEVLDPNLKRRQASERLREAASTLDSGLRRFYHSGGAEARAERDTRLVEIRKELLSCVQKTDFRAFSHMLDAMMVTERELREIFLNVASLREEDIVNVEQDAEAKDEEQAPDDDPWAEDPWAEDESSDDGGKGDAGTARREHRRVERPEIFANRVVNAWAARLRHLQQNTSALEALNLKSDLLGEIIDELLIGSSRMELYERIAGALRQETMSVGGRWADAADRVVRIAFYEINDFVGFLGFGDAPPDERPGFPEPPKERTRSIFSHKVLKSPGMEPGGKREQLERAYFIDWGVALRVLGVENISHSSGREISEERNQALGEILKTIDIAEYLD